MPNPPIGGQLQQQKNSAQQLFSDQKTLDDNYELDRAAYWNARRQGQDPPPAYTAQGAAPVLKDQRRFSSLTKDEQKAAESEYQALKDKNSLVRSSDIDTPYMRKVRASMSGVSMDGMELTQEQLYTKVKNGDCTHMQSLDPVLRNRAATEYMMKNPISANMTAEDFVNSLKAQPDAVSKMMNPLLRMGISLVINSQDVTDRVRQKYLKIDELLNKEIMVATITKKNVQTGNGITAQDRQRNQKAQIFILKSMLVCHMGKFKLRDSDAQPPDSDWPQDMSVANAFAHCSRVMITMPKQPMIFDKSREKKMLDGFCGDAGFKRRGCATHNLILKRRRGQGEAEELKQKNPLHQWGMNIAVGGLGNNGIPTGRNHAPRLLKNDGTCGHLFMHRRVGDSDTHSGFLIGFESDSVGVMNQTGHVHDMFATPEFASSFGGQRCDEVGDKYGGRHADLSGVEMDAFNRVMELVDHAMVHLLNVPDAQADTLLNSLAQRVCGKVMSKSDLKEVYKLLLTLNGVAANQLDQQSQDLADKTRP